MGTSGQTAVLALLLVASTLADVAWGNLGPGIQLTTVAAFKTGRSGWSPGAGKSSASKFDCSGWKKLGQKRTYVEGQWWFTPPGKDKYTQSTHTHTGLCWPNPDQGLSGLVDMEALILLHNAKGAQLDVWKVEAEHPQGDQAPEDQLLVWQPFPGRPKCNDPMVCEWVVRFKVPLEDIGNTGLIKIRVAATVINGAPKFSSWPGPTWPILVKGSDNPISKVPQGFTWPVTFDPIYPQVEVWDDDRHQYTVLSAREPLPRVTAPLNGKPFKLFLVFYSPFGLSEVFVGLNPNFHAVPAVYGTVILRKNLYGNNFRWLTVTIDPKKHAMTPGVNALFVVLHPVARSGGNLDGSTHSTAMLIPIWK